MARLLANGGRRGVRHVEQPLEPSQIGEEKESFVIPLEETHLIRRGEFRHTSD